MTRLTKALIALEDLTHEELELVNDACLRLIEDIEN